MSTAKNTSLLSLSLRLRDGHGMASPGNKAQDHEPNVYGHRPVSVAQNDSLFVLVCVWLTDMLCVPQELGTRCLAKRVQAATCVQSPRTSACLFWYVLVDGHGVRPQEISCSIGAGV